MFRFSGAIQFPPPLQSHGLPLIRRFNQPPFADKPISKSRHLTICHGSTIPYVRCSTVRRCGSVPHSGFRRTETRQIGQSLASIRVMNRFGQRKHALTFGVAYRLPIISPTPDTCSCQIHCRQAPPLLAENYGSVNSAGYPQSASMLNHQRSTATTMSGES